MNIIIKLAIAKNGVIGKTGSMLPWDIPEEMKLFVKQTKENVIIMGRKTFDTIGKPLPKRVNIVVSRTMHPRDGIIICTNIKSAIEKAKEYDKDIFIVGGAEIVKQSFEFANKMYLSHLKKEYEGDIYFPVYNKDEWEIESKEEFDEFDLVVYKRI